MARILLIDDEADLLTALTMILKSRGHQVNALPDALTASKLFQKEKFDLIISDIRMQPMDGMQLLEFLHQHHIETPIIMLTAHATLDVALQAIKKGAFDFITKPFKPEALLELVQQVLEQPMVSGSDISLDESVYRQWLWHEIIARSHQMKGVCHCLELIAPTNEFVLLIGEEGTGKRFAAEIIHASGPRSSKIFQSFDCATPTEKEIRAALCGSGPDSMGILEKNTEGTVLLENIDALPAPIGQQLAEIIKSKTISRANDQTSRPIDVRFMASCRQLNKSVNWVQPLASFTVAFPPLRERIQDLLPLISLLIHKYPSTRPQELPRTISTEAYKILAGHAWPRNIDELREVINETMTAAKNPKLTPEDLPERLVSKAVKEAPASPQSYKVEELRGKSFRDYVRRKQVEMKKGKATE